jgi:uncharacterized membrane protein HdeD (DUF308 family)
MSPEEEVVRDAFGTWWWLLVLSGILWLIFGFLVLSLRPGSISAVVIAISIAFWFGGITLFMIGGLLRGGWRWLAIIGGVVSIGAGIAAIAWPGPTLVVVSVFVAWYLLVRGLFDVAFALMHTHMRGWWIGLIGGIIGIGLGVWAIDSPERSVLLFVSIIGIWAIFKGVGDLISGFELRHLSHG